MYQQERQSKNKISCRYFLKGQCKKGNLCKFNHNLIKCYLIRHAQSIFNQMLNSSGHQFDSQEAKNKFHLDKNLIDCGLTQKGYEQIDKVKFPQKKEQKTVTFDLIFSSPLQRCLKTLQSLIIKQKVKTVKVIVLPGLTEVVSKICDFGHSLQYKKNKYQNFDFSYIEQTKQHQWQDHFLDQQIKHKIQHKQKFGNRYLGILEQIFPKPLENSYRCFERTLRTIDDITQICRKENAKKILVVSHNRIIKYTIGRHNKGRSESVGNCQVKMTLL